MAIPEPHSAASDSPAASGDLTRGSHADGSTHSAAGPVPASSPALAEGSTLGPYRLLAKLGEGGMGAVYKAQHEHLDKLVAIKVLPAHVTAQPDAVARFKREMKAVGKLEHPHIVQAHDAGEIGGVHFLAMEYVDGADLTQLVKEHGPLSVTSACQAVRQAALGLAAAHEAGLIHRDIKPSNLLVGKRGDVKLLDLGLARLAGQAEQVTELTTAGQTFGTPDYMAPEQWDDAHTADARSDLYALGCTLYFLLTGHAPFATEQYKSLVGKMKAHVNVPPPDLRAARSDVPDGVVDIYQKLLAKDPANRYQTATELAAALLTFSLPSSQTATIAVGASPYASHDAAATSSLTRKSVPARPSADGMRRTRRLAASGIGVAIALAIVFAMIARNYQKSDGSNVPAAKDLSQSTVERQRPSTSLEPGPKVFTQPFGILADAGRPEREFDSLDEAVNAAESGDTIEVRGDGPFVISPINLAKKILTIRAAKDAWPVLILSPEAVNADLGFLTTQAALTLEGLEIRRDSGGKPTASGLAHISSSRAPLAIAGCRFVSPADSSHAIPVFADQTPSLQIRNCEFYGGGHGPGWRMISGTQIKIANSVFLTGKYCLTIDVPEPAPASVQLLNNTMIGKVPVLVTFGFSKKPVPAPLPPIRLETRRNICSGIFLKFYHKSPSEVADGFLDRLLPARLFALEDQDNHFAAGAPFGNIHIAPRSGDDRFEKPIATHAEHKDYWKLEQSTSVVGPLPLARDFTSPMVVREKLTPQDFRSSSKNVGADVDLVGPGPAYEKWKLTAEYQQWLKDTGQIKADAPFVVLDAKSKNDRTFATLAEAVAAAKSGDIIEIRGNGPFVTGPLHLGKALVLRAGAGFQPVLQQDPDTFKEYVSFLTTTKPLVLEGLEIRRLAGRDDLSFLEGCVESRVAPLFITHCRFWTGTKTYSQTIRTDGPRSEIRNSLFVHGGENRLGSFSARTVLHSKVIVENNLVVGNNAFIDVWTQADNALQADVQLRRNTILGHRINFSTAVPTGDPSQAASAARVRFRMEETVFDAPTLTRLHQIQGMWNIPKGRDLTGPDAASYLRRMVAWTEQANVYSAEANLLTFEMRLQPLANASSLRTLGEWNDYWGLKDTGSAHGTIIYQGGDLLAKTESNAEAISPADFRLAAGSAGKGVRKDGKDLGADVDNVGPGLAYDKWRQTPEYQEWLRTCGITK